MYNICTALATESFSERKAKRLENAKGARQIREKISKIINKIKEEYTIS